MVTEDPELTVIPFWLPDPFPSMINSWADTRERNSTLIDKKMSDRSVRRILCFGRRMRQEI